MVATRSRFLLPPTLRSTTQIKYEHSAVANTYSLRWQQTIDHLGCDARRMAAQRIAVAIEPQLLSGSHHRPQPIQLTSSFIPSPAPHGSPPHKTHSDAQCLTRERPSLPNPSPVWSLATAIRMRRTQCLCPCYPSTRMGCQEGTSPCILRHASLMGQLASEPPPPGQHTHSLGV